jgi:hypothetical protein
MTSGDSRYIGYFFEDCIALRIKWIHPGREEFASESCDDRDRHSDVLCSSLSCRYLDTRFRERQGGRQWYTYTDSGLAYAHRAAVETQVVGLCIHVSHTAAVLAVHVPQDRNVEHGKGSSEASRLTAQARKKLASLGTTIESLADRLESTDST